jgi:hypothetical protein
MAGLFDWARALTGDTDNPEEDIGNYADTLQKQNRAAIGLDANGNPLPAAAASPSPGAQAAAQAAASSTLPPNQEPNATKTPVSLGHLMMNLQQYNEREQGFNQALGAGFAAASQPRDRDWVRGIFNVTPADPTKIAATQQALASNQQGQDRTNALGQMLTSNDPAQMAQAQAIANSLNIPLADLKARYLADPAGVGQMIQNFRAPTDQMKNLEQIQTLAAAQNQIKNTPGFNQKDLDTIKTQILAGVGGPEASAMIADQINYRNTHGGQDPPWAGNIQGYRQFVANEKSKEDDRAGAAKVLADNQNTAEELRGSLEQLRDSPGLKSILADPVKRAAAQKALSDPSIDIPGLVAQNVLSNQEAAAVATLRKIGGQSTETAMHSMAGTGTRVTQQEVGPLKDAISTTQNLNQDYDTYVHNAINPFITKIKKTVANAYGASGNLNHMDPEYEPWLHPIYRPGGELFKEGGGADKIPDLQPLPAGKLSWAKNEVSNYPAGKEDALDALQQEGFDVSKLRKTDPKDW